MATFKVVLKRIGYAEVLIEAANASDARRQLADEETIHELFHTAPNAWYDAEIKVKSVARAVEHPA